MDVCNELFEKVGLLTVIDDQKLGVYEMRARDKLDVKAEMCMELVQSDQV